MVAWTLGHWFTACAAYGVGFFLTSMVAGALKFSAGEHWLTALFWPIAVPLQIVMLLAAIVAEWLR